jgi:tetrahydromethanopterin S-methyltransferase subunit E
LTVLGALLFVIGISIFSGFSITDPTKSFTFNGVVTAFAIDRVVLSDIWFRLGLLGITREGTNSGVVSFIDGLVEFAVLKNGEKELEYKIREAKELKRLGLK